MADTAPGSAGPADSAHPALSSAGWTPERDEGEAALANAREVASLTAAAGDGASWELFPAAERAVRAFHGLRVEPAGDGASGAGPTGSTVDPLLAAPAIAALRKLSAALGVQLFPLGRTDTDTLLAVDEADRLLGLGGGEWWLLGEDVAEGLEGIAQGRAPTPLRTRRWSWPIAAMDGEDAVGDAMKTATVCAYVLHHSGVFSTRSYRVTAAPRRTGRAAAGEPLFEQRYRLRTGPLEENAERIAEELRAAVTESGTPLSETRLAVTLLPSSSATAPWTTVTCTATVNGPRHHTPTTLALTAGPGASTGPLNEAVTEAAKELERYAGQRTGSERAGSEGSG
ncbi:SUKH-3 domain-containing protein [Streptomyces sp. ODS28]|uniref:SUKH-3 domain-containing protein n=1 Tax=Streptomyces sp. ODS28 TaxID=3136688 RepID=UPI0031E64CB0